MIKIVVSFDYELFLGENFCSDEEILFNPTQKLLKLLSEYEIPATFFADVCSVYQHRKYGLDNYADIFEKQLAEMMKLKNDVQLHIHSNWLKSSYENEKWNFDVESYRIHFFGFDENSKINVQKIISEGKQYLENLLQKVNKDYKCVAFRAGGYSVQPHSELVRILRENDIYIESSVCRGAYIDSQANKYDFRCIPDEMNWWITPDKAFAYEGVREEGGVFEIPICTDKNNLLKRVIRPETQKGLKRSPLKGKYISLGDVNNTKKRSLIKRVLEHGKNSTLVSLDSMKSERMIDFFDRLIRKNKNSSKDIYVSIIGHPKLCDDAVLENMEKFLIESKKRKDINFITMRDAYDDIMR